MIFRNRSEAGRWLADRLKAYAQRPDVIVLALPRGGVPVGFELARALEVPLDVFLVRKLGLPGQEELAMGAIASGGVRVLNDDVVGALGVPASVIDDVARKEEQELRRREQAYRGSRPMPDLSGREWAAILPLLLLMLWMGTYTQTFLPSISAQNARILDQSKPRANGSEVANAR